MAHLANRYGGEAPVVIDLVRHDPSLGSPIIDGLPYLAAEVVHAVRYEMATTLDDVLSRRTRARLQLRDASADAAGAVADLMGAELGWDTDHRDAEVASYLASVAAERASGALPVTSTSPGSGS
jgi:glycerol-3-phosphate dehydrogenase